MSQLNLKSIKNQAEKEIKKTENLTELEGIFKKYLGKTGVITQVLRSLEKLSKEKKAKIGKEANELKKFLKLLLEQKTQAFKEKVKKETEESEWLDVTLPGKKPVFGHLHPLTLARRRVEEIFQNMGFSIVEGPEIESEWYHFDALNIPKDHPARDLWNTLWLKNKGLQPPRHPPSSRGGGPLAKLLLRTHTSPVQIRYMEKNQPPLRIIVPGRVFRHEATDASHEINFYHIEGLMLSKDISVANFKAVISEFFKRFFNREIAIRMRPSYFPFVEPGFEVDIICLICGGKGCSACGQSGWMEMMGAGMVHPAVFKNSGLVPTPHQYSGGGWQGFAFGMGFDRLAMMKYKINDIRLFYSGDLRFLQQF